MNIRELAKQKGIDEKKATTFERGLNIDSREHINMESRTVEFSFSSEEPVERWFGYEILDHSPESVDLGRLQDGAAVLVNHDPDQHVGVVESARIDSGERKGRVMTRFGRGDQAQLVLSDIEDGIRRNVSVGYRIDDLQPTGEQINGIDVYRASWMPYEVSIVAIPADARVGVGRSMNENEEKIMKDDEKLDAKPAIEEQRTAPETQKADKKAEDAVRAEAVKQERERVEGINSIVREHPVTGEAGQAAINDGTSIEDFRTIALAALRAKNKAEATRFDPPADNSHLSIYHGRGKLKAFENTREGREKAYRSGMWAQAVVYGNKDAERWCKDYGVRVMTGLTSDTASVVPDEMVTPIIDLREQYGVARQRCFIHPMSSDTATVPRRTGGVTAYFPGRDEATTASDMSFDDINLVAREVSALTIVAKSYAADAVVDLGDLIAGEMAYAFAVKEDDCLFNGDGTSTYGGIYGIRPKIIDGNHTAGAIDAASGIDTLAEITADDLVTVSGALPEYPGINPAWYTSKRGNALVFEALKAAGGGNTIADLGGRPNLQWLGDEIVISQSMPKVTTDLSNVAMLVYGDLRMGVTFGDRMGFEVDILRERYAEKRQIGIIATERMDIVVHGLGDNTDAGPIVAMIGE